MQMHDTLRSLQGGTVVADLATAFDLTPLQVEGVMRTVMPELAWHLEQNTLSRCGLADLVAALGKGNHARYLDSKPFRDEAALADGRAILSHILGSKTRSRALAAKAARRAGVRQDSVRSMLPALAILTMGALSARAKAGIGEVLDVMPSLGRWSRGSPHADLADILRRGCGAGPHAPAKLRRVVRRALARAGGFKPRGPMRWYLQFMSRPAMGPARAATARLLGTR
jgi:hypothetical protein